MLSTLNHLSANFLNQVGYKLKFALRTSKIGNPPSSDRTKSDQTIHRYKKKARPK